MSGFIDHRQHLDAGGFVVFAVHPRDGLEMRELPEENNQEQKDCFNFQFAADGRPAQQWRHGAGKRAHES